MTMKIKTIGVLCLLAVMIAACSKEGNDAKNSEPVMYVQAEGGLRMRDSADTNANVILTIPNSSQVTVLETKEPQFEISGKSGKWTKVKYQDKEGWVFGGFLTDKKPESKQADSYSIRFGNQESDMFSIQLSPDGAFKGSCYNGFSGNAEWSGRYSRIDDLTYQLVGNAESYSVGSEGERKVTVPINTTISFKLKADGKRQVYSIEGGSLPGCDEITIEEGVLKNDAYGSYNFWADNR